jgi:hypothetical protein
MPVESPIKDCEFAEKENRVQQINTAYSLFMADQILFTGRASFIL